MNKPAKSFMGTPLPEVLDIGQEHLFEDIQRLVDTGNDYVTSILEACAKHGIDPDSIAGAIKSSAQHKAFKKRLHDDCRRLHMVES